MSFSPLKIVLLGPVQTGKSFLANMLVDAKESPGNSTYRPTKGARILEMQMQNAASGSNKEALELQLWDCSGNECYEACWSAAIRDAHAIVLVYCPANGTNHEDQVRILENFCENFRNQHLADNRYLIIANQHNSQIAYPSPLPGMLRKLDTVIWEENSRIASEFQRFIAAIDSEINAQREEEEQNILHRRKY